MSVPGEEGRERNLSLPYGAGSTFINDAQLAHTLALSLGILTEQFVGGFLSLSVSH
jgi:hypothetical protein